MFVGANANVLYTNEDLASAYRAVWRDSQDAPAVPTTGDYYAALVVQCIQNEFLKLPMFAKDATLRIKGLVVDLLLEHIPGVTAQTLLGGLRNIEVSGEKSHLNEYIDYACAVCLKDQSIVTRELVFQTRRTQYTENYASWKNLNSLKDPQQVYKPMNKPLGSSFTPPARMKNKYVKRNFK